MVNLSCTQWKHYTLCWLEVDYYCHYYYLYKFCKSLFKLSYWNPIQRLLQATHRTEVKLVSGWMFGGYSLGSSCYFTEVLPELAAGGRFTHLTEPRGESLETDLGTVIKLLSINILIQNNCFFSPVSSMSCDPVSPIADFISKLDEWDTALFIVF